MIHELSGHNIYERLRRGGFVRFAELKHKQHAEGFIHLVLDFAACNPTKWNEDLQVLLKQGIIDFNKRNADGSYGVRRDYTETEKAELSLYPIQFSEDGTCISWCDTQGYNERPAIYASYALPDILLSLTVGSTTRLVKNGQFVPNADTVPVIRCKDCRFYDGANTLRCNHPNLDFDVECYDHWLEMEPYDFCSRGELKNN